MSAASSSATGTCQPQSNKVILRQVDALYSPPAALPKSPSPTNVPAEAFRAQEDSVCKCLLDQVPRKHAGARGSAAAGPVAGTEVGPFERFLECTTGGLT